MGGATGWSDLPPLLRLLFGFLRVFRFDASLLLCRKAEEVGREAGTREGANRNGAAPGGEFRKGRGWIRGNRPACLSGLSHSAIWISKVDADSKIAPLWTPPPPPPSSSTTTPSSSLLLLLLQGAAGVKRWTGSICGKWRRNAERAWTVERSVGWQVRGGNAIVLFFFWTLVFVLLCFVCARHSLRDASDTPQCVSVSAAELETVAD